MSLDPTDSTGLSRQHVLAPAAGALRRLRLRFRSAEQSAGSVTLLKAPIGFGKSTLLKQWLAEARGRRERALMVALTVADREPETLALNLARVAGAPSLGAAFADWIERLLTGDQAVGATVFFDNWDDILGSETEQRIAAVISAGELRANLCIAGRRACGLPVDELLADGRLRVIGQNALRFSQGEQQRLLGGQGGTIHSELLDACDGWPLALQFLRSVEQSDAPELQTPAVFARRAGLEAMIARRLDQACTAQEQALLDMLGFSVGFDAPLLDAVRGTSDSDAVLDGVASLLPFDIYGDGPSLRYRPNPLVRAILQRRFDALGPGQHKAIANRAFQKAMGQGRTLDAIDFALLSGDHRRAIGLIEAIGPLRLIMTYGVESIQDVLSRIPTPLFQSSLRLKLVSPVIFAKQGYVAEARAMAEAAIREIEVSSLDPAAKMLALREGVFVKVQISASMTSAWADEYERAAEMELAKEPAFAAWSRVISGVVGHQIGRLDDAEVKFDQAQAVFEHDRAQYQLAHIKLHRGHVHLARGKLGAAARAFREVKRWGEAAFPTDVGLLVIAELGLIEAGLLSSRSSIQAETVANALARLKLSDGWYEPFASAYVSMSRCLWRDEGLDAVLRGLDEAEADLKRRGITIVTGLLKALRLFYLMLAGRGSAVDATAPTDESVERHDDESHLFWRERHLRDMAVSMLMASRKQLPDAIAGAETIIEECRRDGRHLGQVEAHLNRALILSSIPSRRTDALQALIAALDLAGEVGAHGSVYEWRELIEAHAAVVEPGLTPRANAMLARLRIEWQGRARPDLLTGKEIVVLTSVAAGLSNKQISREVGISADGVKFHLKQCFRKLNVQTRAEAVEKAKAAQLL